MELEPTSYSGMSVFEFSPESRTND